MSASRSGRFNPRERGPGTHYIRGCVGLSAGLDAVAKRKVSCPCRQSNSNSLVFQPVADRYTDGAIPAADMIESRKLCVLKFYINP
jgi:hypothetical protein